MKKVCLLGANSYIGESFVKWVELQNSSLSVTTIDTKKISPGDIPFQNFDCAVCVVGIAHKKVKSEDSNIYYKINRDLVIELANKAKEKNVKQFIVLSSMSVFGKNQGVIEKNTKEMPSDDYGKSKLEADLILEKMNSEDFKVCIVRPPMVYGKNCKGNYQLLRKFAFLSPIFPKINNKRSMIYIDNLSDFLRWLIENNERGIFYPQNDEYVSTTSLVKYISKYNRKKIFIFPFFKSILLVIPSSKFKKVFGDLTYNFHENKQNPYTEFEETIRLSEL